MTHYNEQTFEDIVDYEDDYKSNIITEEIKDKEKEEVIFVRNYYYINNEKMLNDFNYWKKRLNKCFYQSNNINFKEFEYRLNKFINYKNICKKNNINIDIDFNYINYNYPVFADQVEWWLVNAIGLATYSTFSTNIRKQNIFHYNDIYLIVILRGYYYGNVKIIPTFYNY